MSEEQNSFWDKKEGVRTAFIITFVVAAIACFWNLASIGIWEPWEANDIAIGSEYANRGEAPEKVKPTDTGWNWAVPTKGERPVAYSLLKAMVLGKTIGETDVKSSALGTIERGARAPFSLALFLFILGAFFWVRARFGTRAALVTCVAFSTMPAIFIGSHNVASELMFIVTSSATLLLFYDLRSCHGPKRYLYGAMFGVALTLAFLDLRLFGLYLPLFVIASLAATEAIADPGRQFTKWDALAIVAVVVAILAHLYIASYAISEETLFAPHHRQWMAIFFPLEVMALGLFLGRNTWVTRTFFSIPAWIGFAMVSATLIAVGVAYGDVNPVLLRDGVVVGKVPVFQFLLENEIFDKSIVKGHVTFDVWIRQIGFSLLPWAALAPLAFAYLARVGADAKRGEVARLAVVWIAAAFFALALGSAYQHYFFVAYYPFALGIGLAFDDTKFWESLRNEPLSKFAIGIFAIGIILMLGKDVERFPPRFIELYLSMQDNFELPDDFSYGRLYKPLKYVWLLCLGTFFFTWVTFAIRFARSIKTPKRLFDVFKSESAPDDARAAREAIYEENGVVATIATTIEKPATFALFISAIFAVSMFCWLQFFIPNVTRHVSQRGVFETYSAHAKQGEELYRFQVSARENSVYLQDVESITGNRQFFEKFEAPERFFAVIPRDKLASINMEIRKKYKKNLPVLDARSGRLLLVSNQLLDGEENKSFVAKLIVDGEAKPQFSLAKSPKGGGEPVYPVFDNQLEFLGFDLDNPPGDDGVVSYAWGKTATLTYYFRVLKRVPSNQKIFLHVDYPGVRISGDHYPNNGDFPTNYWLPGDVVKSVHPLEIESYSTPGEYSLHFGFFLGSRRMTVTPKARHDGSNRVRIGKIRITSGL